MKIELASINDFQEILRIQKEAFKSEAELYQNFKIQPLTQSYEDMLIECSSKLVIKAIINGKIVGAARAEQFAGCCHINKIVVLPEFQRKGIGTELLKSIETFFPKADTYKLETGAKSKNNINLYHKVGYKITNRGFFNDNVEAVFMEKPNN